MSKRVRVITMGAALIMMLTVGGCGWFGRGIAKATGFSRHCIEGVMYFQFASGATVAYNPDGTVKTCD